MRFSELGTGQSINLICKPWVGHFGSYFGRLFVLLVLLIGPILGMIFSYLVRKSKTMRRQRDLEIWFRKCLRQYWNLELYIASLPANRWVRRVLCWCPLGRRRPGNPRHHWLIKFIVFSRYKHFGNWEDVATQGETWLRLRDDLAMFCNFIS